MRTAFFQATDSVKLSGILYNGENTTNKIIISVHGMATNCMKMRDEVIAKMANEIGIDYFVFNNRGHDLISYFTKENGEKVIGGTAFEEISDCFFDILGAINWAIENKYDEIYLLGHSLGCTKIVFFYHKMLEQKDREDNGKEKYREKYGDILKKIKGVVLLSMVDIPTALRVYLNDDFAPMLTYAKNMEREQMQNILMPKEAFIHPISVKNFLRYARDYKDIDFAQYSDSVCDFKELNEIDVPLFMRWGNERELILQYAKDLCQNLDGKIQNSKKNIGYIDGADHSYTGKEQELADELRAFFRKYLE